MSPTPLDNIDLGRAFTQLQVLGAGVSATAAHLRGTLQPLPAAILAIFNRPDIRAGIVNVLAALDRVESQLEAVDAPGYTPYFERLGHDPFMARFHASFVRRLAIEFYQEDHNKRVALSAFHDLARRPRWHPALARQVGLLCEATPDGGVILSGFNKAGQSALAAEYSIFLQRARKGDHAMGDRLIAIMGEIAPFIPSARGRPLTFAGALHQAFLCWNAEMGARDSYTYGPVPGSTDRDSPDDYTDAVTAATRIELRRPGFSPVAARRAVRKRRIMPPQRKTIRAGRG